MKIRPTIPVIRRRLQTWFETNRRDLPWRRTHDPYLIAVSEVMLQQTQVDRVKEKFLAWKKRWPTTHALSKATLHDVLTMWSGLGYNSRGKRLRDAAQVIEEKFKGKWPRNVDELESLPGFGPYTARAVASFAYNADVAVIDTNVRRVLSRIFFGVKAPKAADLDEVVNDILPVGKSAEWNATLMDFGSAVCASRKPKCEVCPVQQYCRAYPTILEASVATIRPKVMKFQETDRFWRGEIVRQVIAHKTVSMKTLRIHLKQKGSITAKRIQHLVSALQREGVLNGSEGVLSFTA